MLRATNNRLRKSLPEMEPEPDQKTRWRLVKHIQDAKTDPSQKFIVDAIISINVETEKLLTNKAGLLEAERLPPSFATFMQHSRLLRLAWETEKVDAGDVPFPIEIDADIQRDVDSIRSALGVARTHMLR